MKRIGDFGEVMARLRALVDRTQAEREAALPDIQAAEDECRQRHRETQRASFVRHLGACGVPEDLLEPYRGNLRPSPAMAEVKAFLASEKTFLVLTGGTGAGKSVAAVLALKLATRVIRTHPHPLSDGVELVTWHSPSGLFVRADKLLTSSRFTEGREVSLMDRAATAKVLVLDELRASDFEGKGHKRLEEILGERYSRRLRTVLTSNMAAVDLREKLGERLASRLSESARLFDAGNTDMRRERP